MANYPKKITDPTEAALSAIQEALNIQQDETQAASRTEGMADLLSEPADKGPQTATATAGTGDLFGSDAVGTRDLGGSAAAANDDQRSIGQILQALQRRPARASYFVATVFSCAWIVGCLSLSFAYLSDINASLGPGHSSIALMVGLAAAELLPIIFFFGVAHMAWRAQELRLIAQSMARVAMRLAEPEGVARDSVVTVGQAVRREVAAMGDGVERALARASELEALVQNEVAALERSYSDNEVRIRGVLQDLASQRDLLVEQAEQVRAAISNVHVDLTQDLSTISDLVAQQVNEAAERITQSLAERGEQITLTLGQTGDNMVQQLSDRGSDLLERLEAASDQTSRAIASASERLSSSLDFKTNHIDEEFAEIATGLEDMMTTRLDRVTETFSEKSLAVVDLMIGRSQTLTDVLVETSNQLAETITTRAEEVNGTLKSSGESLIADLDLRGSEAAAKLQQTGNRITEAFVSRTTSLADSMRESAEHVAGVIATRNDAVKEMLATRLAAFEEMFNHTGAELGERVSRDSSTLGNLITRHLAEFDRTVKTYGSELVERLGARTQDVSESMRNYVDNFDSRVTSKGNEVAAALDQRLVRFQEVIDGRSKSLTDALSARVVDVAKTLADVGKEAVSALDKRITEVTSLIDTRATSLAETVGERIEKIDTALGKGALEVAGTLDSRVDHLEELLVGRAEAVVHQMEVRSRAAADLLNSRMEQLSESIKTNSTSAERALSQLAAETTDTLVKSAAASTAATEALNRSAAAATEMLNRSTAEATVSLTRSAAEATEALNRSAAEATVSLNRSAGTLSNTITKSATTANEAIGNAAAAAERKLVGMGTEVSRNLVGKANEIHSAVSQSTENMMRSLDEKSNGLLLALTNKGQGLAGEVGRITDQTVKAIDARGTALTQTMADKSAEIARLINDASLSATNAMTRTLAQMQEGAEGVTEAAKQTTQGLVGELGRITEHTVKAIDTKGAVFTQTLLDKSAEIARLINDASLTATSAMTRTLGQMQEGAQGVTEAAKQTISRTLEDLQRATKGAIEESKQTAAATVAEMLETHTMLRSDSTALFERLREANILLQEVLSGAHENMSSIEHTMASRVSEFVAAMSDLSSKSGATTAKVEQHLGTFNTVTAKVLHDLGDLADQFSSHGRTLVGAVELIEASNRRTEDSIANRNGNLETLVSTLDARTEDFGQRLSRFSSLLDESLDTATARAREIASLIAESSGESVQAIEQQYDLVRTASEDERRRTNEVLSSVYEENFTQVQAMFNQSAERFAEVMRGMKQMAAEMQQELETTRADLRRGILELPQETTETTAQMRRVIVEQIEALAELNRIVARHGRAMDIVEPLRREAEPLYAAGSGRGQVRPMRGDIASQPQQASARDITGAPARRTSPPTLSPVPGGKDDSNGRNGGWLSDILARASRDDDSPNAPAAREERAQRDNVDSIDSLSVDIARMIDHDAAAELWERYKRGERGVFSRRLYTQQGQKAFDAICNKYRADPEFRQTVEQYIHEFERLLDDVSRGDRGPAVARNYLTSDTGKVYTMLAHAAGRFD